MEAIAALYDSDGSDVEDAESTSAERPSTDNDKGDSGADTDTGDERLSSRKRRRVDDSAPSWHRAFAHVDGNWPSHVKIDVEPTDDVIQLVDRVVKNARGLIGESVTLVPMASVRDEDDDSGFHLSLSRPFVLTFDQIDVFVGALRAALKWRSRFHVTLGHPIVLVNDETTRSFLALQIGSGADSVVGLIKCVDKCMHEFGLEAYYKDPIPHVSIASALGDSLCSALSQAQLDQLRSEPEAEEAAVVVRVTSVRVVIGNKKHFHIPLR